MAVTMSLYSKAYTYGTKAFGYVSKKLGCNNSYTRQLASANKKVLEGSSVDLLRSLKRELPPKKWKAFKNEYILENDTFVHSTNNMGVLEKEEWTAKAMGKDMDIKATNWLEYIKGLINKGKLSKDSTYKDFAKALINN